MARPTRPTPRVDALPVPSNALVASALRLGSGKPQIYQQMEGWQQECYRHYAICGEARFAANFFGHAMSKVVLNMAHRSPDGLEKVTTGAAYEALADLFKGKEGQAQMLQAAGIHLTIGGECYLVGRTIRDDGELREGEEVSVGDELWEVLSPLEVGTTGTGENTVWWVKYGGPYRDIELDPDDAVIRIWQPDPAHKMQADSPFKSLLPILTEIEWLTRHIFAQISSRLTGAGILFLPQGMTFPPPRNADGKEIKTKNSADAFMRLLGDIMTTAMEDNATAESRVPIIVEAPDDLIDKAKLMHFWSDLDAVSKDLRSEAIHRFAAGMDLPIEQVLGMSGSEGTGGGNSNGVSHWGAWQIEESTIKMHIEPMCETLVNAITIGYIRPQTDDPDDVTTYDTAALKLRPDRSKEALELHALGRFSDAALFREIGMDITDLPGDEELKWWFLRKIASGSATPEQVAEALKILFKVELPTGEAGEQEPRESRPAPSLEEHPTRPRTPGEDSTPDPPPQAALLSASEGLVLRALEKMGNRILNANKRGKDRTEPTGPIYQAYLSASINGHADELLKDGFTFAPEVLDGIADHARVTPVLQDYCKDLFREKAPHSRERLSLYLTEAQL